MANSNGRLGVIPARSQSSRFPGKILAPLQGKPMIWHVWDAAERSQAFDSVLVATEDEAIAEAARGFGAEVVLTPRGFESGTERVAWVAAHRQADIIVNLQGDEPLLPATAIRSLVTGLQSHPDWGMVTLACPRLDPKGLADPNVVKVVCSASGEALYFSRQPLASDASQGYLQHVGIYGFRREVLERWPSLSPSPLERAERLEQLRAMHHGIRIGVLEMPEPTIGVDTPEDLVLAEAALSKRGGALNSR